VRYMFVNALSAEPEKSAVCDAPQVDLNGADVRLGAAFANGI